MNLLSFGQRVVQGLSMAKLGVSDRFIRDHVLSQTLPPSYQRADQYRSTMNSRYSLHAVDQFDKQRLAIADSLAVGAEKVAYISLRSDLMIDQDIVDDAFLAAHRDDVLVCSFVMQEEGLFCCCSRFVLD